MQRRRRRGNRRRTVLRQKMFLALFGIVMITVTAAKVSSHWGDDGGETLQTGAGNSRSYAGESQIPEVMDMTDYPEKLAELYQKNPDARPFVEGYFENKDKEYEIDLSEYENTSEVPLLMQWDERWGYRQYAGNFFGLSGCGPTVLSMVTIYLTGDSTKTPVYMEDFAEMNGYAVTGNGTDWAFMTEGAAAMGIEAQQLPLMQAAIDESLMAGNPVVCIMGPGNFTTDGHFIVLTGIEDGKYTVNDSNSYVNSSKTWSYEEISGEIQNLWVMRKADYE